MKWKSNHYTSFAPVCHSVHRVGAAPLHAGIHTLLEQTPPGTGTLLGADTPPDQRQVPPGVDTPQRSACWEIRATSGR